MINDSLRVPSLKNKEIGITTFANLNHLEESEPFGRYLQERLSYHLFSSGFRLKELRMGKQNRFIPKTGELNITRLKNELKEAGYGNLKSIIIGTYIDAGEHYYVNAKLIELRNSLVRASGELRIKKGKYLKELIDADRKNPYPGLVFERVPMARPIPRQKQNSK